MTTQLKQRLVGVIVILALLAAFLPELLRRPGNLPTKPMPPLPSEPLIVLSSNQSTLPVAHTEKKSAVDTATLKAALEMPRAWVLLLGSFKNADNAARLQQTLKRRHLDVYVTHDQSDHLTRVYIGPVFDRDALSQLADRLNTELHLKGLIQEYKA